MDWSTKLIELAENDLVSWEAIARECIAEMSTDEIRDVCVSLNLDDVIDC